MIHTIFKFETNHLSSFLLKNETGFCLYHSNSLTYIFLIRIEENFIFFASLLTSIINMYQKNRIASYKKVLFNQSHNSRDYPYESIFKISKEQILNRNPRDSI